MPYTESTEIGMTRRQFLRACGGCVLAAAAWQTGFALLPETAGAVRLERGFLGLRSSPYFTPLDNNEVQCTLCPRDCIIPLGERGHCEVRENRGGELQSLVYGNPCAVNVDPVEKKPFYHLLPGSKSFSIATAGCNLDCVFCQNHEISQARPENTLNYELPPDAVVAYAARHDCATIASTYVEPTIFIEYMLDVGRLAREAGILNVMHSAGYINPKPLDDLCDHLDAACIDLKGYTEEYYKQMTGGRLQPVLDALVQLRKRDVHLELVTLLLPGKNDQPEIITAMSRWITKELGRDTILHLTRFYPRYKLRSLPPTPLESLMQAREAAMAEGLRYVYIGNVPGNPAQDTRCPKCDNLLIHRDGYQVLVQGLKAGVCDQCGKTIPGTWS